MSGTGPVIPSSGRPPTPREDAPPGERTGFTGWLRSLGFQGLGINAPPRGWRRENVCLVSDESDLVSANYGPRADFGCLCLPQAGSFMAFRAVAGDAGCRVFMDIQTGGPAAAGVGIYWNVYPTLAAAEVAAALTAATGPANPLLPLQLQDANKVPTSRVFAGRTLASVAAVNNPVYFIRDVATAANGFFHHGATRMRPSWWLAPGHVLHMGAGTAALPWYLSGSLEEPGSAPR